MSHETQKKQQQKIQRGSMLVSSGFKNTWVTHVDVQSTHLTKNTQGVTGFNESEDLAANRHLTTNAPVDSGAPELFASSEVTD